MIRHDITPGIYRLRAAFVAANADRRLKGFGLRTAQGIPKGARVIVRLAPWRDSPSSNSVSCEMSFPFAGRYNDTLDGSLGPSLATPVPGTVWYTEDKEILRLLSLCEPDESNEAWVEEATGMSWSSAGCASDVLTQLLNTGRVQRHDVLQAIVAVSDKERQDVERAIRQKKEAEA